MSTGAKTALLWALGALALIALAKPAPNVATMLVVVLIAGLVLANWQKYASYLALGEVISAGKKTTTTSTSTTKTGA